jgi:hypothetical protein
MPRTKGSKNKNINTAKNKNIININVNSSKSKRGRPRKTTANTNTQNRPPTSGGSFGMAPPQVIITQPPADNSNNNSLLSSFITSKMLNETMNLNRSNMTNVEPSRIEQPSYFNARESIIPKLPETPLKQELQPPPAVKGPPPAVKGPPPPPPPPPKGIDLSNKIGVNFRDAMIEELKYAQTDEGKAEKARKKVEAAAKKEAKKMEKETAPNQDKAATKLQKVMRGKITRNKISNEIGQMETQIAGIENLVQTTKQLKKKAPQSTADFLNLSFSPPKRDIVEMMTPKKDTTSSEIIPYRENKSFLDFVVGGSPAKKKTATRYYRRKNES